jgi:hypothetical protein
MVYRLHFERGCAIIIVNYTKQWFITLGSVTMLSNIKSLKVRQNKLLCLFDRDNFFQANVIFVSKVLKVKKVY